MRAVEDNFLGRGIKFPVNIDNGTGGTKRSAGPVPYYKKDIAEDLERINGSIEYILTTPIGQRFFLPEFGSSLHQLVFEQNDDVLYDLLKVYIIEALARWEPRIRIIEVVINKDKENDHKVNCVIEYEIIKTQVRDNFVVPFYRDT